MIDDTANKCPWCHEDGTGELCEEHTEELLRMDAEDLPDITCLHAEKGMCPQCVQEYLEDPGAWVEFGQHAEGQRRWAEELRLLAEAEAEAEREGLECREASQRMKQKRDNYYDYGSELPVFKKLGRRFFADRSAEEFWEILIHAAAGDWDGIEEMLDEDHEKPVPLEFQKLHHNRLVLWTAFSLYNHPASWSVGVIRHRDVPFCRPILWSEGGCDFFIKVGPPLERRFTPRIGSQASLEMLEAECYEYRDLDCPTLPDEFTNHVPQFVSRKDIEEVYRKYWNDSYGSFDETMKAWCYGEKT